MNIDLLSISWKNFMATGNDGFELSFEPRTTLIIGPNGSGKSTVLDALCYVLFDRTYRGQKKTEVINNINNTGTLVKATLNVGGKQVKITRGMKPAVFEIEVDGKKLDNLSTAPLMQKYLETQVLRLNFRSFIQIVMLGSASFVPFMQLKAGPRREVVEDILDIGILSSMGKLLKADFDFVKSELNRLNADIETKRHQIRALTLQAKQIELARSKETNADEQALVEIREKLQRAQEAAAALSEKLNPALEQQIVAKIRELSDRINNNDWQLTKIADQKKFFMSHSSCPTCKQTITDAHKEGILAELEADVAKLSTIEIKAALAKLEERNKQFKDLRQSVDRINRSIELDIGQERLLVSNIERQKQSDDGVANITRQNIASSEREIAELEMSKAGLQKQFGIYELASVLLKDDGIRGYVVSQYLPKINQLVNFYLNALEFFVEFSLDDSFNETIRRGFRDVFSYESFSEGEKRRIDLALLFTWRAIAKLKNSVNTNLLILDEVFDSSLDDQGMADLQKILGTLGESTKILVISHRGQSFDRFERVVKVRQDQRFSVYEEAA